MKLPNSFIPKKNLDGKVKRLLKEPNVGGCNLKRLSLLLESCEHFSKITPENDDGKFLQTKADELAADLTYTKKELEEMSKRIKVNETDELYLGFYLSSLVRKIISKDTEITLTINERIEGLGRYLEKGTLILEGNVGDWAGEHMKGGQLIILGNAESYVGAEMMGGKIIVRGDVIAATGASMIYGEIIVKGSAGVLTGDNAEGGIIRVNGNIKAIHPRCKARIYLKDKQIWPKI